MSRIKGTPISQNRYENTKYLAARYLARPNSNKSTFCKKCGIQKSQFSHLLGDKPTANIGDTTAKRIEKAFKKEAGWLSIKHEVTLSPQILQTATAEMAAETFVALVREMEKTEKSMYDFPDKTLHLLFITSLERNLSSLSLHRLLTQEIN